MEKMAEEMKELQKNMARLANEFSEQIRVQTLISTTESCESETEVNRDRPTQRTEETTTDPRSVINNRNPIDASNLHMPAYPQPITHYVVRPEVYCKITTFTGTNSHHPVLFLKECEQYFRVNGVPEGLQTSLVFGYLAGSALKWAEAFVDREAVFVGFGQQFLETFWGATQQREVRFEMYQGTYKKAKDGRMADYFAEMVGKAKHLRPTFTETELVEALTEHFPPDVSNLLLAANMISLGQMMVFLRKLDRNEERKCYGNERSEEMKVNDKRPVPNVDYNSCSSNNTYAYNNHNQNHNRQEYGPTKTRTYEPNRAVQCTKN
jgi:hypothetical protein